jgi:type I restriction enzyme S subunit
MNAKQFLAEFGHIANAQGGVMQLRELVLSLAIQGKLVAQNSTDKSAEILLERIKTDNKRLERKKKKITEDSQSEMPFNLPHGWVWTSLGVIAEINGGFAFKSNMYSADGVRVVRISDFDEYGFKDGKIVRYPHSESSFSFSLEINNILMAMTGGTVGKSFLVKSLPEPMVVNQRVATIKIATGVVPEFINGLIRTNLIQSVINAAKNSTNDNISMRDIAEFIVPLPPLEEQSRIVAKVDELMTLCDTFESQQLQKRQLQNQTRQATLQAVSEATSPFELKQHWQRLLINFEQLFSAPEDVDEFSAHIKELAVQGLFTLNKKHRPDINNIKAESSKLKESYIAKKIMRKQKLVSIAECSVIYPENWELQAFDDIAIVIGGVTKGRKLQGRELINCPYLAVANVQRGFFKLTNIKTIDIPFEELEKYSVQQNDLLITEGGDWDKVGRTAIWKENIENCIHQNHIFKARVPSKDVLNSWVELVFNSNVGRDYFAGASKQTTNLASINMTQLRSFPFPIPPIEQQKEILDIVESLEKLCSSWRKKYKRLNELSSLLASTSVSALTGIGALKEEKPLKTPITELVSPVILGLNKPSGKDAAPLATLLVKQNGKLNANDLWQRFGGEIDAFYAQLKTEINHGWILEPTNADMLEKDPE